MEPGDHVREPSRGPRLAELRSPARGIFLRDGGRAARRFYQNLDSEPDSRRACRGDAYGPKLSDGRGAVSSRSRCLGRAAERVRHGAAIGIQHGVSRVVSPVRTLVESQPGAMLLDGRMAAAGPGRAVQARILASSDVAEGPNASGCPAATRAAVRPSRFRRFKTRRAGTLQLPSRSGV